MSDGQIIILCHKFIRALYELTNSNVFENNCNYQLHTLAGISKSKGELQGSLLFFICPSDIFHHKSFKKLVRFDESQVGDFISNQILLTVLNKQY